MPNSFGLKSFRKTILQRGVKRLKKHLSNGTSAEVWPGAAIRVVAAPQVVYLSARLGFTLRVSTGPDQGDRAPPYSLFVVHYIWFSSEVGPGEALS